MAGTVGGSENACTHKRRDLSGCPAHGLANGTGRYTLALKSLLVESMIPEKIKSPNSLP